jgi:hypothetical protein
MPNRRSPHEPLSPAELTALTRVAFGEASSLPQDHRDTFMRMGLAVLDRLGNLVLTDAGRMRHERRWQGTYWQSVSEQPRPLRSTSFVNSIDSTRDAFSI